jgi:hypothetical protein
MESKASRKGDELCCSLYLTGNIDHSASHMLLVSESQLATQHVVKKRILLRCSHRLHNNLDIFLLLRTNLSIRLNFR